MNIYIYTHSSRNQNIKLKINGTLIHFLSFPIGLNPSSIDSCPAPLIILFSPSLPPSPCGRSHRVLNSFQHLAWVRWPGV